MTGKKKPRSVVERGFFWFPPGPFRQVKFVDERGDFPYFMGEFRGRILPKSVSCSKSPHPMGGAFLSGFRQTIIDENSEQHEKEAIHG